ncbi:MAG: nucleotide exchange factor GrpE [Gemmatimonadota bacterium]|nr:nucleotide exchange factor GrpE [Gemmatimonadota bacterium]MDH5195889.1 nucleotide exchange factor GrpE [Gemmatimonadota bacterium]
MMTEPTEPQETDDRSVDDVDDGASDVEEAVAGTEPSPLEIELGELKDRYLRLAAEYDNYRKRSAREQDECQTRAKANLARRLLDALDDLGRVAHLDPEVTAAADLLAGVELVERKMLRELGAAGLELVQEVDVAFDPAVHEAIATVAAATAEQDHTVAAIFQVGYRFNGTLLRPARVQVRIFSSE